MTFAPIHPAYPCEREIDRYAKEIMDAALSLPLRVEVLNDSGLYRNFGPFYMEGLRRIVRFTLGELPSYYGVWQPVLNGPAPLAVHLPGYSADLSAHESVGIEGFNFLALSPMGYWTPQGFDESLKKDGQWPVLPDTVRTDGRGGYFHWLMQCVAAVRWAQTQPQVLPERIAFYGTSQGGGGALLMGSIFCGQGTRCVAADEPFLTNFPLADFRGAYFEATRAFGDETDMQKVFHSLGYIDTLSHAHRMQFPVLLTSGGADMVCPPETVFSLFERLPNIRSLTHRPEAVHCYGYDFMPMALAWMRLYV